MDHDEALEGLVRGTCRVAERADELPLLERDLARLPWLQGFELVDGGAAAVPPLRSGLDPMGDGVVVGKVTVTGASRWRRLGLTPAALMRTVVVPLRGVFGSSREPVEELVKLWLHEAVTSPASATASRGRPRTADASFLAFGLTTLAS